LIEGGAQVAGSTFKAGIVDKVHFFYAPKILGGGDGIPMCAGQGPERMSECMPLSKTDVTRVGDDILVSGYLNSV
jgi:diaminohydroxyphosphoribosylaminopyrimidine deaminase/5-amino-6-(5-phosphoribosylamino)uracil reductase